MPMKINQPYDSAVNIIIDECCYSRAAMTSILKSPVPALRCCVFEDVNEFITWRESFAGEINSIIIHIHDQMNMMRAEIVRFLVEDIERLKLDSHKVIIVSDAISKLKSIFVKELNIVHFVDGRSDIEILKLQLKDYVGQCKGSSKTPFTAKRTLHPAHRRNYRARSLSPAELIAVTNVFTGRGVKESSKEYSGHYKTLYNQRMSAIRKLGMHTVQDLIKYRHLISALYLIENVAVKNHFSDAYC